MKKVTDNTLKGYRRGWEEEGECKREKETKEEERGCHQREQRAKKRENNKDSEGWEFIKAHSITAGYGTILITIIILPSE